MRDAPRVLRVFWPLIGGFGLGSVVTFAWPGGGAVPEANAAELAAWQQELARQAALVAGSRAQFDATTDVLVRRFAETHARLIALDAATTALMLRSGIDAEALARDRAASAGVAVAATDAATATATATAADGPGDLAAMLDSADAELTAREQELAVLARFLPRSDVVPRGLPLPAGRITSRYGERRDPFTGVVSHHEGIDIAARPGTPIVAVASGLVTWSGPRTGYGRTIDLEHGHALTTRYAHNAENLVDVGDYVRRGQIIARLGASGRTTGPNLHFEVLRRERSIDPLEYVD